MVPLFGRSRAPLKHRGHRQCRHHRSRPRLELLEDRTLLATVGFAVNTGTAAGGTAGTAVAVDPQGNVYANAAMLPGSYAVLPLVSYQTGALVGTYRVDTSQDNVLVKYSSSGQLLWSSDPALWNAYAQYDQSGSVNVRGQFPGLGGFRNVTSIAVDGADNVYAGFNGTPIDVAKIDGTTGAPIWVVGLGPPPASMSYPGSGGVISGLALDPTGNVYITGNFHAGPNQLGVNTPFTIDYFGATPVYNSPFSLQVPFGDFYSPSGFVLELNNAGQYVWGGGFLLTGGGPWQGAYHFDLPAIACDSAGNVYVAGGFGGSANFDPNGGTYLVASSHNPTAGSSGYPLPPDAFVLKLNAAHQLVWVDDMSGVSGGPYNIGTSAARAVTTDVGGNVYLTGALAGDVNFDPRGDHEASSGNGSLSDHPGSFVEKLDTTGAFQWVTTTPNDASGLGLALDPAGNVWTVGSYGGSVNFGAAVLYPGPENTSPYVWQLDPSGNPIWAGSIIGTPTAYPYPSVYSDGIAADSAGDIFVVGGAGGALPVRILPGPGEVDLDTAYYSAGGTLLPVGQLGFLVKLVQNTPPIASAGGPYSLYEGGSLTLDGSASSDTDGDALSYSWTINGQANAARGVNSTLSWSQLQALGISGPGTSNVSVQVDDGHGFVVTSAVTTLTVQEAVPTATITPPASGVVGQVLPFLFGVSDPSPVDQAAGFTYMINWGDGTPLQTVAPSPGNGAGITISHVFSAAGSCPVQVTVTDVDGETGTTPPAPFTISPATTTTALTSSAESSVYGQITTLTAGVMVNAPGAGVPTGTVTFQDGATIVGTATLNAAGTASFTTSALNMGSHTITATYQGDGNFLTSSATLTQTVNPLTPANLQQVLSPATPVSIAVSTNSDAGNAINAVNQLPSLSTPVTVTVDFAPGTYSDIAASPQPGVTLVINGNGTTTTIVGQSPALTVTAGNVTVAGMILTTSTDAPTILVSGGSLALRNDTIQESSGFIDAAIAFTGGVLDLGTSTSPGGNTLNVNGTGEFVHNTTPNAVPAVGDTFEVNGTPLTDSALSFTAVASSVNPSLLNQAVSLTASVRPNGSGTPTGSVDFLDTTTNTDLGSAPLVGGTATLTTTTLGVGNHVILASYSGDSNFTLSMDALTQAVHYGFSGFLSPLGKNLVFGAGRTVPIKFQLADANGASITSLSAISSLQIQPLDGTGNPAGAPFDPTPAGGTGLRNDGSQYVFNWQTQGLSAGSCQILLALLDGTTQTVTVQITSSHSSGAQLSGTGTESSSNTGGALLGGDLSLFVNDPGGLFTSDEWARIQDAINAVDTVVAPYGVTITLVDASIGTAANVVLDTGATSVVGGYADGVLGCYADTGEITLIQGWNWYAGADPSLIGAGQYDFQTVVTHELGHALGLGESSNPTSVMYSSLATGAINRTLSAADLNVPYTETGGDAMHASVPISAPGSVVLPGGSGSPPRLDGSEALAVLSVAPVAPIQAAYSDPTGVARGSVRSLPLAGATLLPGSGGPFAFPSVGRVETLAGSGAAGADDLADPSLSAAQEADVALPAVVAETADGRAGQPPMSLARWRAACTACFADKQRGAGGKRVLPAAPVPAGAPPSPLDRAAEALALAVLLAGHNALERIERSARITDASQY
jgi:hypothetical protein